MMNLPRMADHAQVLQALDRAYPDYDYFAAFQRASERMRIDAVEDDDVAVAVRDLAVRFGTWTGTATELLKTISPRPAHAGWPRTPQHLSRRLREIGPGLRALGVHVERGREGAKGTRTITIGYTKPPSESSESSVEDEARAQADGVADGPDDADDASQDPYTTSEELGGTLSDLKKDGESFEDMFERRHKETQTDLHGKVKDRSLED